MRIRVGGQGESPVIHPLPPLRDTGETPGGRVEGLPEPGEGALARRKRPLEETWLPGRAEIAR